MTVADNQYCHAFKKYQQLFVTIENADKVYIFSAPVSQDANGFTDIEIELRLGYEEK